MGRGHPGWGFAVSRYPAHLPDHVSGLAPMIFERSVQAQFLIPMALSLGYEVLFATLITLILIPCGFVILADLQAGLT